MSGCIDNYAADAANLGEALRCICNVSVCAKTFVPFHKLGIYLCCTSVTEELIGEYLTVIHISYTSNLLWKWICRHLPGREPESMYKFTNVLLNFYLS